MKFMKLSNAKISLPISNYDHRRWNLKTPHFGVETPGTPSDSSTALPVTVGNTACSLYCRTSCTLYYKHWQEKWL